MRTIPERESLQVEFKSDRSKLPDSILIDAVVALANTDGGHIYLGVEDDGSITGLHPDHKDPHGLVALVMNRTIPSVDVSARMVEEDGGTIMDVSVPRMNVVVASSDGRILKRRLKFDGSPESVPMYPFEIPHRLSNLSSFDFSAQILPDAGADDLDPRQRDRLRETIGTRHADTSLLSLLDEDFDKALGFTRVMDGRTFVTASGLLMIGKKDSIARLLPTARSVFQVLEGSRVRVNEDFTGPIAETIEIFEGMLMQWNRESELDYGMQRIPIQDFPTSVFREALVNAFCHRDYTMLGRVRVLIDELGLSISNPGGFIEGVNADNLLMVEPRGRNPLLCDIFKRIGFAERAGRGVDRIYEGLLAYGRPAPDYSESTQSYVRVFISRKSPDIPYTAALLDIQRKMGRRLSVYSLLVLRALREDGRMSLSELSAALHLDQTMVESALDVLQEMECVNASGSGRRARYSLSSAFPKRSKEPKSIPSGTEAEDAILSLARGNGSVSRQEVAAAVGVSADQAYNLLRKLADRKALVLKGKGAYARYYPVEPA